MKLNVPSSIIALYALSSSAFADDSKNNDSNNHSKHNSGESGHHDQEPTIYHATFGAYYELPSFHDLSHSLQGERGVLELAVEDFHIKGKTLDVQLVGAGKEASLLTRVSLYHNHSLHKKSTVTSFGLVNRTVFDKVHELEVLPFGGVFGKILVEGHDATLMANTEILYGRDDHGHTFQFGAGLAFEKHFTENFHAGLFYETALNPSYDGHIRTKAIGGLYVRPKSLYVDLAVKCNEFVYLGENNECIIGMDIGLSMEKH